MPHRSAVADRAAPAQVHHADQRAHRRMRIAVGVLELGARGRGVQSLGMGRGAEHVDDVELAAVTQRIMHDMQARPAPQHHAIARHVGLELWHRHDGAQRHIADRLRLAVADQLGAEQRADTVRGDERGTGEGAAVRRGHRNAFAAILVAAHHRIGDELDGVAAPAGIEQDVMHVDAMDDDVGMFETGAKRGAAGGNAHQFLAAQRIQHQHRTGGNRRPPSPARSGRGDRTREKHWARTGCRSRWRRIRSRLRARGSAGRGALKPAPWSARQARRRR